MGRLDGKVAVITGACSGIGLGTVELFVAEGAHVLAADIQDQAGAELAKPSQRPTCLSHANRRYSIRSAPRNPRLTSVQGNHLTRARAETVPVIGRGWLPGWLPACGGPGPLAKKWRRFWRRQV